ncbi:MAG: accessory factor UbiK family protein, partial [Alloalcanivorax xenomutans]
MQSQPFIDRLMADIQRRLPGDPGRLRDDVEHSIRAVLGEALARLDLISREEFAVQPRGLDRTRETLEARETQGAALERAAQS